MNEIEKRKQEKSVRNLLKYLTHNSLFIGSFSPGLRSLPNR